MRVKHRSPRAPACGWTLAALDRKRPWRLWGKFILTADDDLPSSEGFDEAFAARYVF
jgi:hypothetical protein